MNFTSPYTAYVLAAYGISALLLVGMAWRSWCHWRSAKHMWNDMHTEISDDESEVQ